MGAIDGFYAGPHRLVALKRLNSRRPMGPTVLFHARRHSLSRWRQRRIRCQSRGSNYADTIGRASARQLREDAALRMGWPTARVFREGRGEYDRRRREELLAKIDAIQMDMLPAEFRHGSSAKRSYLGIPRNQVVFDWSDDRLSAGEGTRRHEDHRDVLKAAISLLGGALELSGTNKSIGSVVRCTGQLRQNRGPGGHRRRAFGGRDGQLNQIGYFGPHM